MSLMELSPPKGRGGQRPNSGRKSLGSKPRDDLKISVERLIAARLQFIAQSSGRSAAEIASEILREPIEKLYDEANKPRRTKAREQREGGGES